MERLEGDDIGMEPRPSDLVAAEEPGFGTHDAVDLADLVLTDQQARLGDAGLLQPVGAREQVVSIGIEEADDQVVPRRLAVAGGHLGVMAAGGVVVDQQGNEELLDRLDHPRVRHDVGSELLAAGAAGHLLEEGEDRPSGGRRCGERVVEVVAPPHGARLDRRNRGGGDSFGAAEEGEHDEETPECAQSSRTPPSESGRGWSVGRR